MNRLLQRPSVPAPEASVDDDTAHARKSHILSAQIQGPALAHLLARCRAERTTVTGALAAAVMLEIKRFMPSSSSSIALKMETMVNKRQALVAVDPRYAPCLHCFAAPIDTVVVLDDSTDIWALARAYKQELSEAMEMGQWKRQVAAFHSFRWGHDAVYKVLARLAATQQRVKAAAISNLGVLDNKEGATVEQGDFGLGRLQWGIGTSIHSPVYLLIFFSVL